MNKVMSVEEITAALRNHVVPVIEAPAPEKREEKLVPREKIVDARNHGWMKLHSDEIHRVGNCQFCDKESFHLDAHEYRCILNPDRRFYNKTVRCQKCGIHYGRSNIEKHRKLCNGDTASSIARILASDRQLYNTWAKVDAKGNRHGIFQYDYPDFVVDSTYRLLSGRGMPKAWTIGKNLNLVIPTAKEKKAPVVAQASKSKPSTEATLSEMKADPDVALNDFVRLMVILLGENRASTRFQQLAEWRNMTETLLS